MELKIDFVAKAARPFEDIFTRGINCGGKWYNIEDYDQTKIDSLFNDELLAKGNVIEAETIIAGNRTILKNIRLVKKAEPRQQFRGNYNKKTPVSKEEAFSIMEECVSEAKRIANKHIEAPASEDIRTLANTLFIRIMDK